MKLKQKGLFFIVFIISLLIPATTTVYGKKITTSEFIMNNQATITGFDEALKAVKPKNIVLAKTVKGKLDEKDNLLLISMGETNFPACYEIYSFANSEAGKLQIEVLSMGDMMGFTKTIMFPLIKVYDKDYNEINPVVLKYETRSPTAFNPFHVYCLWEIELNQAGEYYLLIASDNSTETGTGLYVSTGYAMSTQGIIGGLTAKGLLKGYPVQRSPYGEFRLTLK